MRSWSNPTEPPSAEASRIPGHVDNAKRPATESVAGRLLWRGLDLVGGLSVGLHLAGTQVGAQLGAEFGVDVGPVLDGTFPDGRALDAAHRTGDGVQQAGLG